MVQIPSTGPFHLLAQVLENRPLPGAHFLLSLACPRVAESARPGQFVMLSFPGRLDPLLPRPMSVSEVLAPQGRPDTIRVLHKVVGRGTSLLGRLAPGDSLAVLGPLGRPFEVPDPAAAGERALMVAGGIGIAVFPFLLPELKKKGWVPVLLFGARSEPDLVGREGFLREGVETLTATEDGSHGSEGLVTRLLEGALKASPGAGIVYGCGPRPMLRAVGTLAGAAGIPCQLSLESYMGCGFGVCLGCVVKVRRGGSSAYARVCVEGPTFTAAEVLWE